ncbi:SGNH/GDSL hydrolase family protein [Rubrivirga litoralis]|uniref:GDSL-type esterase/lipase family protein n=1 Tax=Rubrivirga litoralis TaxID=3075598 RepID=A0ABU3BQE5_9BACT|nr:GDSL-type esterase/lipase family protein [Rubrivirga sp. F394]MDT0631519.1 GDSL-type esterase/lipase family protein [Rubrivirga sp. F394]
MTRLLCLGDSYTVGEGVAPDEAWPARVAAALRTDGLNVAPPTVVAQTGWTTEDLAAALDAAPPDRGLSEPANAVTLLIGVNDQYRRPDADAYRARFAALLARAVALAGGPQTGGPQTGRAERVVVVSIPDWGRTPHGAAPPEDADVPVRTPAEIGREVDAFNAAARAEADAAGARWVDVTALSREQGALVAADGLHPSGAAYAAWAERIAPAVRAALGA